MVLIQAFQDLLLKPAHGSLKSERRRNRLQQAAHKWFFGDSKDFLIVCALLEREPVTVRTAAQSLLDGKTHIPIGFNEGLTRDQRKQNFAGRDNGNRSLIMKARGSYAYAPE